MRARSLALVAFMALAACSNEVADAEKELAIIEQSHGSKDEICTAKRKVAAAYLKTHDQGKYEETKLYADIACQSAQLGG